MLEFKNVRKISVIGDVMGLDPVPGAGIEIEDFQYAFSSEAERDQAFDILESRLIDTDIEKAESEDGEQFYIKFTNTDPNDIDTIETVLRDFGIHVKVVRDSSDTDLDDDEFVGGTGEDPLA